jgi:hypothetical protein
MADPFRGPSRPKELWTLGMKNTKAMATKEPEDDDDLEDDFSPPAGQSWERDDFLATIDLRPNSGVSVRTWATMGFWRRNHVHGCNMETNTTPKLALDHPRRKLANMLPKRPSKTSVYSTGYRNHMETLAVKVHWRTLVRELYSFFLNWIDHDDC